MIRWTKKRQIFHRRNSTESNILHTSQDTVSYSPEVVKFNKRGQIYPIKVRFTWSGQLYTIYLTVFRGTHNLPEDVRCKHNLLEVVRCKHNLPEVVGGTHYRLALNTVVVINSVWESCPSEVKHFTDRWGIQWLHSLLAGQARLLNLDHHVLLKHTTGICRRMRATSVLCIYMCGSISKSNSAQRKGSVLSLACILLKITHHCFITGKTYKLSHRIYCTILLHMLSKFTISLFCFIL